MPGSGGGTSFGSGWGTSVGSWVGTSVGIGLAFGHDLVVQPDFVRAVIQAESAFNPFARSVKDTRSVIDMVGGEGGATGRSKADAPEIDGEVHLRDAAHLAQGDIVCVRVEDADEHDLYGVPLA